jgi:hypothetical protein
MSRVDELEALRGAEIAVAELEAQFIADKDAGIDRADRATLRDARRHLRELRASDQPVAGDALASPAAVTATARAADWEGVE